MPEFSNYLESRTPVVTADGTELVGVSKDGESASMTTQQIALLPPVPRTGVAIAFDLPANYGTLAAPETGDITLNATGLIVGVTQILIHQENTSPESQPGMPAEFKVISGAYESGAVNYIFMHSISASLILVTICQEI